MKKIIIIIGLLYFNSALACSMFKITENGKTIIGNNEDWISSNSEIWFEPAKDGKYGVAYLGFLNHFPQGAINEAGLVFDAFVTDYLQVEKVDGKKNVSPIDVTYQIMRNLENVHQVKAYFEKINLSYMARGVFMFVDKTGEYLIVEGDILTLGNDPYYLQSNFIPSQNPTPENVKNVDHYLNGLQFINNSTLSFTTDYCVSVMKSMEQKSTQYTSIYDLENGIIELYHYQNYENKVIFNLKDELRKPAHSFAIPLLFPKNTKGLEYYNKFNDTINTTKFIKDLWNEDSKDKTGNELEEFKNGFVWVLNNIGYEWLNDKKNVEVAISIFKYGTELFPDNSNLFDSLGEAYWKASNSDLAIYNYNKSLVLNSENANARNMIKKIEQFTFNDILVAPIDWRKEIIPFPLPFVKSLQYSGVEEIRFSKGWSDMGSNDFWTYVFVWHINDTHNFSEVKLQNELELYFNGLMKADEKNSVKPEKSIAVLLKNGAKNYFGKVKVYDAFFTKKDIILNVKIHITYDKKTNKEFVVFKFSPKDFSNIIWHTLDKIKIKRK